MATPYWRIDLYNEETEETIEGKIRYATDYQAELDARGMTGVPDHIQIKIVKCEFNF